jgi:isocitrate/isopropylmalate dehydrogenase
MRSGTTMSENDKSNHVIEVSRANILILMDSFIEQITSIRKTLLGVSISALILAPLAIGLSVYLIVHPSFFAVLEIENEFGLVLSTLMCSVLVFSSLWLISGIKQYLSMGKWSKRYNEYVKAKEEMDRKIAIGYGLGTVSTPDQ